MLNKFVDLLVKLEEKMEKGIDFYIPSSSDLNLWEVATKTDKARALRFIRDLSIGSAINLAEKDLLDLNLLEKEGKFFFEKLSSIIN